MLANLQSRLMQTAEKHHSLAIQLKEYAERESRMCQELEDRKQVIISIENELKKIT
jgi:hypothetical protein